MKHMPSDNEDGNNLFLLFVAGRCASRAGMAVTTSSTMSSLLKLLLIQPADVLWRGVKRWNESRNCILQRPFAWA
jgi:hypothetical protein